jgi:hypothetical protein
LCSSLEDYRFSEYPATRLHANRHGDNQEDTSDGRLGVPNPQQKGLDAESRKPQEQAPGPEIGGVKDLRKREKKT